MVSPDWSTRERSSNLFSGLPPLQNGPPPPPPTLTVPSLTGFDGGKVYLAIVETIPGCPVSYICEYIRDGMLPSSGKPIGQTEYALTFTSITYSS